MRGNMRQIIFKRIQNGIKSIQSFTIWSRRNYSRTLAGDKIIDLNEDTLTGRILIYFNSNKSKINGFKTDEIDTINKLKGGAAYNLQYRTTDEITSLLLLVNDSKWITNKWEFTKVFTVLDSECSNRLEKLEPRDILNLLNIYMQIVPNRILQYKFYQLAIEKLGASIENLTKQELIQFIFFIGLQKKEKTSQNVLKRCIHKLKKDVIHELTSEELCIICNAAFKTSTKITNKLFLEKVRNYLNDNLNLLKDPAVFITLIKTIRHNHYQDDNLLSTISCTIFFNKTLKYYSFSAICHILALYADFLYYDEILLKHFFTKCIEELQSSELKDKHTYITEYIRDKDLKTFLWSLSTLGYRELDCNIVRDLIIPKIVERILQGELGKDPSSLVEMMLYLWIMNFQAVELVPYIFTTENIAQIRSKYDLFVYCLAL